mmetsp:Transcript_39277/g.124863  ORF Transcript_39277/g.124863 Transcript_39277/m.124863 type:complete len:226 (-) Transcript_39277:94-771(-)
MRPRARHVAREEQPGRGGHEEHSGAAHGVPQVLDHGPEVLHQGLLGAQALEELLVVYLSCLILIELLQQVAGVIVGVQEATFQKETQLLPVQHATAVPVYATEDLAEAADTHLQGRVQGPWLFGLLGLLLRGLNLLDGALQRRGKLALAQHLHQRLELLPELLSRDPPAAVAVNVVKGVLAGEVFRDAREETAAPVPLLGVQIPGAVGVDEVVQVFHTGLQFIAP